MHRYCTGNERQEHARKRRNAAKRAHAEGVGKLPRGREVFRPQPHNHMAVHRQRRTESSPRRPVRPHPPPHLAQLHGREGVRRIAMDTPVNIRYARRPDATPKAELSALAACYRLILDCAEKKAAPASGPEDARKEKDQDARTHPHCT
jgi:hypothetical protein